MQNTLYICGFRRPYDLNSQICSLVMLKLTLLLIVCRVIDSILELKFLLCCFSLVKYMELSILCCSWLCLYSVWLFYHCYSLLLHLKSSRVNAKSSLKMVQSTFGCVVIFLSCDFCVIFI